MYGSFHRLAFDCVPVSLWNSYSFYNSREVRRISRKLEQVEALSTKEGATAEEVAAFAEFVAERKKVVQAATLDGSAIQRWESRHKLEVARLGEQAATSRRKK